MRTNGYQFFIFEAIKITLFCLTVVGIFKWSGADNNTLLITFNMAVMSCAATFSPDKKPLSAIFYGSIIIALSILSGGLFGFYLPHFAEITTIIYAILAFIIPKTRLNTNIFVTGAVMFLIFTSLPFSWQNGCYYALYGSILIVILVFFYWIFEKNTNINILTQPYIPFQGRKITAITAGLALSVTWLLTIVLKKYTALSHLYWIGLTVLVVIQGSQHKMIRTSLVRIIVNAVGALIIVVLMNYIIPKNFWINFILLTLFLFLIFALGFSYIGRTLFIELFVLSFTHLLGNYHNVIVVDRVILTLIGGLLVILSTLFTYILTKTLLIE